MDWLHRLDPNVVVPILSPMIMAFGGWLWAKIRGEKHDGFAEVIEGVFRSFVQEQFAKYESGDVAAYVQQARAWFEKKIWEVLAKRSVPRNAITEALVHAAVEHATADLAEKLQQWLVDRAKIETDLRAMNAQLQATSAILHDAVKPPPVALVEIKAEPP